MLKRIFGDKHSSPTRGELLKKVERSSFSGFLPWMYHDPETGIYTNTDDTQGFLWECRPLAFAGDATAQVLEGLFRLNLPFGSIMQFILWADSHIDPVLERYRLLRKRESEIGAESTARFVEFISSGRDGLAAMAGIPVRQFRLLVCLKFPKSDEITTGRSDIRGAVTEILRGAHLQPRFLEPVSLIDGMRRLFNDRVSLNNDDYDPEVPINRQIIFSDTEIAKDNRRLLVGEKVFRCATVKKFPLEVNYLQTNEIFGGISGLVANSSQVITPFLFTLNILFADLKAKLHRQMQPGTLPGSFRLFRAFPCPEEGGEPGGDGQDRARDTVCSGHADPLGLGRKRSTGPRIAHPCHPGLGIPRLYHAVRPLDPGQPLHRGPAVRSLRHR